MKRSSICFKKCLLSKPEFRHLHKKCDDTRLIYSILGKSENKSLQGNKHGLDLTPTKIIYRGPPIVSVGCGGELSVISIFLGINIHSF